MFTKSLEVGFYETDAFGHINNTRLPVWFELARNDLFNLLSSDKDPRKWGLIMARIEVDYLEELFYGSPVEIHTHIEKIGRSSFVVLQDAFQRGVACARGRATIVHYDWNLKKSKPLPESYRELLTAHLIHK
jgi:acyl-CoA thioester hydrolase